MGASTQGQISVTPYALQTDVSLDQLLEVANQNRYAGEVPGSGWGSVFDGSENLFGRLTQGRVRGGQPEIIDAEPYPRQFRARFYWNELDTTLSAVLGPDVDPRVVHRFRAMDVTIADLGYEGKHLVLVSSRRPTDLAQVGAAIDELLGEAGGILDPRDNALQLDEGDFFLWLLYRASHNPVISDDITLVEVRTINSHDTDLRLTSISKGADLDRTELLALVAKNETKFGPAKLIVFDAPLEMTAYCELRSTGEFSVFRGESDYGARQMSQEQQGLQLVQDLAFEVIPELRREHNNDAEWASKLRQEFRDRSRQDLRTALTPTPGD